MIDVFVLNRRRAPTYQCNKKHVYISVKCPFDPEGWAKLPKNKNRLHTLQLAFDDWDDYQREQLKTAFVNDPNIVFFSQDHAKSIVSVVREYMPKIEVIIAQCDAGISRSPGIAAALAKCINGHDTEFFNRHCPNRRVYRMIMNEWYNKEKV